MKMTTEHYNELKTRIQTFAHQAPAHLERIRLDARCKDIKTRMLFDIFYAAKIWEIYSFQEFNYMDEHIKTAMNKIVSELKIITH